MAESSSMLPLGTSLPQFSLTDVVSGSTVSSNDFSGKPLLVMFICRHCPYVKHVQDELAKVGVYRGQLDDSRPSLDIPVTGKDLRAAIDVLLSGQPVSENQKPSMGCGIKWKSAPEGNIT